MYDNICDFIHEETEKLDRKAKSGSLSTAELQYADMLQHLKKSMLTNEAMEEAEEYSDRHSSYGPYVHRGYMDGGSYARGRNAKRDSRGRYTSENDMISELHDLMERAPEDKKQMFRHFISEMEHGM